MQVSVWPLESNGSEYRINSSEQRIESRKRLPSMLQGIRTEHQLIREQRGIQTEPRETVCNNSWIDQTKRELREAKNKLLGGSLEL